MQQTAYEMRIRDWSSDVCSSDLGRRAVGGQRQCMCLHLLQRRRQKVGAVVRGAIAGVERLGDRQSVEKGKSVSVRVDLGGRRNITTNIYIPNHQTLHDNS